MNIEEWKNHFSVTKGDVGMSLNEKEREPIPRQEVIDNPYPYIFVYF